MLVLRARPEGLTEVEERLLARTEARRRVVVCNGVDQPGQVLSSALPVSATTGSGIDALRAALKVALVGQPTRAAATQIGSARQADWLLSVARAAEEAVEALPVVGVAVSADAVTRGIEALDALTGADTRETILDAVFTRFCIGK